MKASPDHISTLSANQVFVFGSNDLGVHGKGAAQFAFGSDYHQARRQGNRDPIGKYAIWGQGRGFMRGKEGCSYAIATKARWQDRHSLPLPKIERQIDQPISFANQNKKLQFLCTAFGTFYAGRSHDDMASLWAGKPIPDNILLPQVWIDSLKKADKQMLTEAQIADRIVVRQGNAKVEGVLYGFTGVDEQLQAVKVYTGREFRSFGLAASPLGNNEYRVRSHTQSEHQKAVDAYSPWFERQMQNPKSAVFRETNRLAKIIVSRNKPNRLVLTCFCPEHLPCHARDVVKPAVIERALQKLKAQQKDQPMGTPSRRDNPSLRDQQDYASRATADHMLEQIKGGDRPAVRTDLVVISGGQDGADKGSLLGAASVGIPTGGYAPRGWLTERGSDPSLAEYGLVEGPQGKSVGHTYM